MVIVSTKPLWRPSAARIADSNLARFMAEAEARWGVGSGEFETFWQWSVDEIEKFWLTLWDFSGVIAETRGERVLMDGDKMPGARRRKLSRAGVDFACW